MKKVVLVIVEGTTDKVSLEAVLEKIFNDNKVSIEIIGGDITSDEKTTLKNAVKRLSDRINSHIYKMRIKRADILKIIQIIDIDGVYIRDDLIVENPTVRLLYKHEGIETWNRDKIIERNERKRNIIDKLLSTNKILNTDYKLYYFSCNLEHVLHDDLSELSIEEKMGKAEDFENMYGDNPQEFKELISDNTVKVEGNYMETWDFIKDNNNSIRRCTNFHLLFENHEEDE